ncbi:MAG: DNA repair protein RecN [Parasporobacterium sp.]|nr:DNA repair protein RecN [Parasporobacterium sp.]
MLKNVHLKDLALIREADIDFDPGLNILTGETGAGKSIIIGSINIALGDKASKSFIRSGADFGLVELLFTSRDERVLSLLASNEIPAEDGTILISRKLTPDGSTTRINGTSVTLTTLRTLTSLMVDIHGQHDHQSLLNPARHLEIVDEFGRGTILPLKDAFHSCYQEYKSLRKTYQSFNQDPEELKKEMAFLEYELKEIEEAALKPGEDTLLEAEYKKLSGAERVTQGLMKLKSSLFDAADCAANRISDGMKELSSLTALDPDLKVFSDYLMDLDSISRDFGHELSHYIDSNAFNEERYQAVHQRLNEINRLKSKYGQDLSQIQDYYEKQAAHLRELQDYSAHKADLIKQMESVRSRVNQFASQLSDERKKAASSLEQQIIRNLQDLNFLDVSFQIHFEKADKIYEHGFDRVEFLISTNPGEPVRPLIKVASGGELSRIMLAIKSSTASSDQIGTMIFDEIDTGISGRTAQKVAEKLGTLSREHQLICITHLPQIAAMADTHFSIEKSVRDGSTISGIRKLNRPDSIIELARLLSGSEITESTLQNAEEMKLSARRLKDSVRS